MDKEAHCGVLEFGLFAGALIAGTACSLTSKILLDMHSVGMTGEKEVFSKPMLQTFGMFLGMTAALGIHWLVKFYKIPFPGYVHQTEDGLYKDMKGDPAAPPKPIPFWMYFILFFPSVFDLAATTLCTYGLRYVNVSVYQMLRGSAIIFVALLKQFVLKDKLKTYMWVGIFWNVVSIILIGVTVMLSDQSTGEAGEDVIGEKYDNPLIGVLLILIGAFVQSLQYAFEEKVMTGTGDDMAATPPLLLIGMEGFWGTVLCLFVLYPVAYFYPGSDHGSFENPYNTLVLISNNGSIQAMFFLFFISVFLYNMLAILVTFTLNSVWHAILDNFRPITVWGVDLLIFYWINKAFGEQWTVYSFIQLAGMFVLLYGTAVYNAPHAGSIKLTGGIWNCFFDFSKEYDYEEIDEFPTTPGGVQGTPIKTAGFSQMQSPFLRSPAIRAAEIAAANTQDGYDSPYKSGLASRAMQNLQSSNSSGPIRNTIGGSASKLPPSYPSGSATPQASKSTNLGGMEMGHRQKVPGAIDFDYKNEFKNEFSGKGDFSSGNGNGSKNGKSGNNSSKGSGKWGIAASERQ